MKNVIIIFLALFLVSCGAEKIISKPQENNVRSEMENPNVGYFENVMMCYTEEKVWEKKILSQSSAVYLNEEKDLGYTTAHSVDFEGQVIDVHFPGGKVTASVVEIHKEPDFAILKFSKKPLNIEGIEIQNSISIGEQVLLLGYEAYVPKIKPVQILSDNGISLFLEFGVLPGMSGGLVTNLENEVIGMITGFKPEEGNISQILKIEIIQNQIDRYIQRTELSRIALQ